MADVLVSLRIKTDGTAEITKAGQTFAKAEKDAGKLIGTLDRTKGAFSGLVSAVRAHPLMTIFGGALSVQGIRSSIQAFDEEAVAIARTRALLEAHGIEWAKVGGEIGRVAKIQERKTLIADEKQVEALGTLVTLTGSYGESLKALPTINNIAAVTGWDLNQAALAYGRALEGDTVLLGKWALALKGLTDEQRDAATVQRIITEAFGKTSEEVAKAGASEFKRFRLEIDEVNKAVGKDFTRVLELPIKAFHKLKDFIMGDVKDLQEGLDKFRNRMEEIYPEKKKSRVFDVGRAAGPIVKEIEAEHTITGRLLKLREGITREMKKEVPDLTHMAESLHEILALREKEKKLKQEIKGIFGGASLGAIGRLGDLVHAVEGLEEGQPAREAITRIPGGFGSFIERRELLPATGIQALKERFGDLSLAPGLTLGGALEKTAGISGFERFKESKLSQLLQQPEGTFPTAFRSRVSEELFQTKLGMLGRATTPEEQAFQFQGAFQAMNTAQRESLAQTKEEAAEKQKMIGDLDQTVNLLTEIRSLLNSISRNTGPANADTHFITN